MDLKAMSVVAVVMASLCVLTSAMSIPDEMKLKQSSHDMELGSPEKNELDERATWLDTRGLEEDFKELVFLALQELSNEHRITDIIEQPTKQKRGRWQGFCFRRTRSGRFLPYICWKGDRK